MKEILWICRNIPKDSQVLQIKERDFHAKNMDFLKDEISKLFFQKSIKAGNFKCSEIKKSFEEIVKDSLERDQTISYYQEIMPFYFDKYYDVNCVVQGLGKSSLSLDLGQLMHENKQFNNEDLMSMLLKQSNKMFYPQGAKIFLNNKETKCDVFELIRNSGDYKTKYNLEVVSGNPYARVIINKCDDCYFDLKIENLTTVRNIMDSITAFRKHSQFRQTLSIGSVTLVKENTLKSYSIGNNSVIDLRLKEMDNECAEVKSFVDLSETKAQEIPFSEDASEWRHVIKGLNIECVCPNESCPAFGENAICKIGFEREMLDLVLDHDLIKCPLCDTISASRGCHFYECQYHWIGKKYKINKTARSLEPVKSKKQTATGEKCFSYIPDSTKENGGVCDYQQLKIFVEEIVAEKEEEKCKICHLETDTRLSSRSCDSCNNLYHIDCYNSFKEMSSKECPQC